MYSDPYSFYYNPPKEEQKSNYHQTKRGAYRKAPVPDRVNPTYGDTYYGNYLQKTVYNNTYSTNNEKPYTVHNLPNIDLLSFCEKANVSESYLYKIFQDEPKVSISKIISTSMPLDVPSDEKKKWIRRGIEEKIEPILKITFSAIDEGITDIYELDERIKKELGYYFLTSGNREK